MNYRCLRNTGLYIFYHLRYIHHTFHKQRRQTNRTARASARLLGWVSLRPGSPAPTDHGSLASVWRQLVLCPPAEVVSNRKDNWEGCLTDPPTPASTWLYSLTQLYLATAQQKRVKQRAVGLKEASFLTGFSNRNGRGMEHCFCRVSTRSL